ncbi:tRNA (guanosine(46)-N7)-methyltransferase TrmB [Marinilactibacillus psychrotolerans]|uniref:tRNA (guanine-N(7)-)-methyltransferase n=2 Tax=Marinilactibacillus psychrotolerans TaxID=191770 RepID=A0A5R9C3I7_9LACT|nr:tRNA (guanosine(46)-N7)-methyltransferase TrmB [Marinilactibacillus psychrotolerans]TLQ07395.1 tRNA (guanosine(46)-N7)-methyltransferase TrmB [Marinilactibacillus psychrotolerans]GEQ33046.1 tRNA (guanine-N(7)-)-methyltransferase [Marinilactibacillus psychrotolerans]SJN29796.1 tRNA (guanine46-N7-)-methyltransferase [Marinilactibacillus psychrotolerans 42ea]
MRLRNKPGAEDKLLAYGQYVVSTPEEWKGRWNERFDKKQPLHIEIGMGKGRFLIEMAKQNPGINYIGIELQTSVIVSALEKQIEEGLPNVQLLQVNAQNLQSFFDKGEVDRIYLTFSDPWPKNRHEKRRLTYKDFLYSYETILDEQGELHFKTDNQKLFEYSLISFSEKGMILKELYLDLHNSEVENNIMTEYEEKFSRKGNRIYKTVAYFPESK